MTVTIELRQAFVAIARELPGRYSALEAALKAAPPAAQIEFARLVRTFEDALGHEKRRRPVRRANQIAKKLAGSLLNDFGAVQ